MGFGPANVSLATINTCLASENVVFSNHARLSLTTLLGRKDINHLEIRRLCQQFASVRHQRCRNGARKVRLPARVVWEGIKDAERRRAQLNSVPRDRSWFGLGERQGASEKVLDSLLFARF